MYEGGTLTPLEVPGSTFTAAWDINPSGIIVGVFNDATGAHGFCFDGSSFSRIDVPGARQGALEANRPGALAVAGATHEQDEDGRRSDAAPGECVLGAVEWRTGELVSRVARHLWAPQPRT